MSSTFRNSLRLQLVLLIGLMAMGSAVGYVLLTARQTRVQIEQDQFDLQRLLATRMASQLGQDMVARANEMRFLSGLPRLRDPLRPAADKQSLLMDVKTHYPVYAWVGITDATGRIQASTEPRINGYDVSQRSWFTGGSRGLHHEDIHESVLLGKLIPRPELDELPLRLIDIALPLQDMEGNFIGVLAAHLSLDWTYRLRANLLDQLDNHALEMLLVNRSGDVIIGSPNLPAGTANLSTLDVVRQAQTGQIRTSVETWPDGKRYLSTAAPALGSHPYPGLGWAVLVRTSEQAAFEDARRLAWFTLATGLGMALAFSWFIWWGVGRLLRPLESLSRAAADINVQGPLAALPEPQGNDEVAVFTRSFAKLVNALGESRERFQHLFDHAPVAMAFVAPDGQLKLINSRFTQLLGYEARHLPHVDQWFELAFSDRPAREAARARWQQVLQRLGQAPLMLPTTEHALRRLDGTGCTVQASGIVLPDGLLVSFHDLTERELAAQEIRRLNAELEQRVVERTAELSAANRELDSFAYSVSHDLRAPLRTVNGFAQLLENDFAQRLGSDGAEYLHRIRGGLRRMGELIEGLLALSRYTKKPLVRETVDLSAIATRRLAELAAADPDRVVSVAVAPDLVADCDRSLAEALLVNLLDNAWKYSSKTADAQIRFEHGEVDGLQGFCVSDNGAGFDMARAGRLFEPFQRMHSASEFQGTGVGLATVHRIVDRHGGRIVAWSAPGQGARFCFTLRA
ncbi:ATP-binding protein [Hydrogenophaga sp.]|uniref:sensor histidine kinase n=1 Tax=Hydrogenophaga sp. TaxID=1904254 RepID=UPI0035B1ED20